MRIVNIHEGETHFSRLIGAAVKSEPFIIAKAGKPLVQATALQTPEVSVCLASWREKSPCPKVPTLRKPTKSRQCSASTIKAARRYATADPVRRGIAENGPRGRERCWTIEPIISFKRRELLGDRLKRGLRRGDFHIEPRSLRRGLLANDFAKLTITADHTFAVETLAPIHDDPFDRILIAQATTKAMILPTAGRIVASDPSPVRLA